MIREEIGPCVRECPTVQFLPVESVRTVVTDLIRSFRREADEFDRDGRWVSAMNMRHAAGVVGEAFAELLGSSK